MNADMYVGLQLLWTVVLNMLILLYSCLIVETDERARYFEV